MEKGQNLVGTILFSNQENNPCPSLLYTIAAKGDLLLTPTLDTDSPRRAVRTSHRIRVFSLWHQSVVGMCHHCNVGSKARSGKYQDGQPRTGLEILLLSTGCDIAHTSRSLCLSIFMPSSSAMYLAFAKRGWCWVPACMSDSPVLQTACSLEHALYIQSSPE